MIDIADKIYAATGLTLNAEAAAKVGHMIRLARQEATDEIEKLRAALEEVKPLVLGANHSKDRYPKARAVLGEKT
jgi:hypothetical protein